MQQLTGIALAETKRIASDLSRDDSMAHDKVIVLGMVSLIAGDPRAGIKPAVVINDEADALLKTTRTLAAAPFRWVGLIIRLGTRICLTPEYQPINRKHGDLPIAVEIPMSEVDGRDYAHVYNILAVATYEALLHVAAKYGLPDTEISAKRAEYPVWPFDELPSVVP